MQIQKPTIKSLVMTMWGWGSIRIRLNCNPFVLKAIIVILNRNTFSLSIGLRCPVTNLRRESLKSLTHSTTASPIVAKLRFNMWLMHSKLILCNWTTVWKWKRLLCRKLVLALETTSRGVSYHRRRLSRLNRQRSS